MSLPRNRHSAKANVNVKRKFTLVTFKPKLSSKKVYGLGEQSKEINGTPSFQAALVTAQKRLREWTRQNTNRVVEYETLDPDGFVWQD